MTAVPDWLGPLAAASEGMRGGELSRFLPPEDGSGRPSAVLVAFAGTPSGPAVLLIERAADMRSHAGQVAFPGGSLDPGDASPTDAALREAQEEVGLERDSVRVLAELPAVYIPVSGFVVTPVLAWWQRPHEVRAVTADEVARVALVPVAELVEPAHRFTVVHPSGYRGPGFEVAGEGGPLFVWGFTAGLLDRALHFGGWTQPWDEGVTRELPGPMRTA